MAGPSSADLFAYGVVLAVAGLTLMDVRFTDRWSGGAQLAIDGGVFVVLYALAARGGRTAEPTTHRSALLLASLVMLALALSHLTEVLGEDEQFGGESILWASAAFAVIAAATGVVFRSAACTMAAALGAGVLTIAIVAEALEPSDEDDYRWAAAVFYAVACAAGYALRAAGERRHSAQLVTAAAIALILFGLAADTFFPFEEGEGYFILDRGWEALLIVGSLVVLAFALFFRARGPGWAGFVALLIALETVTGEEATLLVWPLFLLGGAALLMIAAWLRARTAAR